MSANNCVRVIKKNDGLYQVRHESTSSLIHALVGVKPKRDELLLEIIADDVKDHKKAMEIAVNWNVENYTEYGVVDDEREKD